ncbi:MAG: SIS domain-containing protein [Firmicutes bacterium]|nr:SIS domain-containing protein [Bacillota bacterium]
MSKISKTYLETIVSLLKTIEEEEQEALNKAATILAQKVAEDRLINVIGPGGHSNMAVEEVFWRAGGLANVNAILDPGTTLIHGAKRSSLVERTPGYAATVLEAYGVKSGDVLIIVNAYGINSMTVDCALEAKKRGITTIGVTSTSFAKFVPPGAPARHPSGKNLYELVDVFIDNHLPLGDAVVTLEGLPQKMGPTSTFVNSFVMNLLMMYTAEKLLAMGIQPPVWTSANLPEGDKLNKQFEEKYMPRIKLLR